jgi:hypothetical protein
MAKSPLGAKSVQYLISLKKRIYRNSTVLDCNICDSLKMRVAAEVSGNPKHFN